MNWTVDATSENVHTVNFTSSIRKAGFEQWVLNISDVHFDNPHCDRKLLFRHLEEAKKRGAPVFMNGDTFCLMQGKYDPRRSKGDIRPEHNKKDYLDAVIDDTADKLAPYAHLFTVMGRGNHEESIHRHLETDVLRRFCYRLNEKAGTNIYPGGYGGWIFWRFNDTGKSTTTLTSRMKYHHGYGGGSPVTKGIIKSARMAVYLPDADIVTTGHIHNKWTNTLARERLTREGRVYLDTQLHLCTGSYKEEYSGGKGGWHVERGAPPKPLGGYWMRFTTERVSKGRGKEAWHLKCSAIEAN